MFILADSGVLLRLFEPSDPQHLAVRNSILELESQGDEIVAAPQNIAEFWNVCTRPSSSRGGFGLDVLATEQRVQDIEMKFSILIEPFSTYSIWRRLITTHAVHGKQVHDARLAAVMLAQNITHILTLNGADFVRYPGIVVIDPMTIVAIP